MREEYGDFAITGLTASPQLLSTKPELSKSVVCGIQMALDFIRENPDQSLAFLRQRFPEVQPQVARSALQRVVSEDIIPRTAKLDPNAWDKAVALRVEVGDVKDPKNFSTYVDNSFAELAEKNCRLGGAK
jgi:NitT/TauT family transport system substrate-binding protein